MTLAVRCVLLALLSLLGGATGGYLDNLDLSWLCAGRKTQVRNIPWDCTHFLACTSGAAYPLSCTGRSIFNPHTSLCEWPNLNNLKACEEDPIKHLASICMHNPRAKMPSPMSCAQYFDCAESSGDGDFARYAMECPYPLLFDLERQTCVNHTEAKCGNIKVPKAPCDYVQYHQLCQDLITCEPCERRHPSCVGKGDGLQAVAHARDFYMLCDSERTLEVRRCPPDHVFMQPLSMCIPGSPTA